MAGMSPADVAFAAQWSLDDLPTCPKGMIFLRQLAEMEPYLYAMAQAAGFNDPAEAELTTQPLSRAFVDHYAACGDCNEV